MFKNASQNGIKLASIEKGNRTKFKSRAADYDVKNRHTPPCNEINGGVPLANLRVKQAADYVGVSKSLLDKLRCYGGGPAFAKLGATVIYTSADLDAWVAANRVAANDNRQARAAA
jgi:predicted DNA-binding transcriptional regulator AlpA